MANDPGWQRRSDEWVKMLDRSRLRKEQRLAGNNRTPESQVEKKIKIHVKKPIDTS